MAKAPSNKKNKTLLDVSREHTAANKATQQRQKKKTPQGNIQKSARVAKQKAAAKKRTTR